MHAHLFFTFTILYVESYSCSLVAFFNTQKSCVLADGFLDGGSQLNNKTIISLRVPEAHLGYVLVLINIHM